MLFQTYDPETVRALSGALATAMDDIEATTLKALRSRGREAVTGVLVARPLAAANSGERDAERLRAAALEWAEAHFHPA